jgi:hypothetical protein
MMHAYHHPEIKTGLEYRETLRAGPYAWPGGYPLILVCDDGGILCFDCGRSEASQILRAIRGNESSGWRVIDCQTHDEGPDEECAHCGRAIPSAYGDPADDEGAENEG